MAAPAPTETAVPAEFVDASPGLHGGWYVGIGVVTLARAIAVALLPVLLLRAPAALVALSPAAGDLVLAAPLMQPWLYFVVAMIAAMGQTAVAFHFGQALGNRALLWLQSRNLATKRTTTRLMRWLKLATPLVLVTMPGLTVSALAGVAGVSNRRFYPLILAGNTLWTVGCFAFGSALTDQLQLLYVFVGDHVIALTAIAASLVLAQTLWSRWRRARAAERALES